MNKLKTLYCAVTVLLYLVLAVGNCLAETQANSCAYNMEAGPIWNNQDAQVKCPKTCDGHGGWNGQWVTTQWGVMSVCGCNCCTGDIEAGPIWDNQDAQKKCPSTCKNYGGWNGQWRTTQPSVMSVCGCNCVVPKH